MFKVIALVLLINILVPSITALRKVVVAPERTRARLSCAGGSITVLSAIYGKGPNGKWDVVMNEVRGICGGKRSCSVPAENSLFDDPAYGVAKDLVIAYAC